MFDTRWSDRLENSAHANPQSSHSCISHTMFHTQTSIWNSHPVTMLLFTIIRSDHLKHSTHTNCQQVALMHTLVPCVCVRHQSTCFFYAFYWDEPEHLKLRFEKKMYFSQYVWHSLKWSFGNLNACKLQNSHSCISHAMFHTCWSDPIIWKSQRIQTPKTRTLVHTLPEYKFTLPMMKLFSCPKSKEFTLAWTATITNLRKQSEVSRNRIFSFLRVSAWCPPVWHYHTWSYN